MKAYIILVALTALAVANEAVVDYVKQLEAQAAQLRDEANPAPLSDEELEMLYRLEMERPDDSVPEGATDPNELEIDLEPFVDEQTYDDELAEMHPTGLPAHDEQHVIEPEPVVAHAASPPAVKKGEAEFEQFVDPAYVANAQASSNNVAVKRMSELHFTDDELQFSKGNLVFIGVVGVCATVALVGTVVAGVAFYKLRSNAAAAERDNMYGVTAAAAERMARARAATQRGDTNNAYSAQLQHYQQTKNEIIRIEQAGDGAGGPGAPGGAGADESDAENEPDYSVYECPGLAPTGDIEVQNPIFDQKQ